MAIIKYTIDSILGGQSPLYHGAGKGQFLTSQAIDPEVNINGKPSGFILPVGYAKFSSSVPSGAPMWIVTNPINDKHYVYAADGEFYSYSSTLASETSISTGISGAGNGAAYYNDYIYLATPTQVYRYGTLSSGLAMSNALIANGELLDGWNAGSDTLLTNTTYPGTRNMVYPNHAMFAHADGFLYLCDYSATLGGLIHRIGTDASGTNAGSQYNVLDLPLGVRPFAISNYGTDLAIVGSVVGSSTSVNQGGSYLFLWNTTDDSFYRQIPIPSPWATAVINRSGTLVIWGGTQDFGYQVFEYTGGYEVNQIWDSMAGSPPPAGAVDTFGNHVAWGSYVNSGGGIGVTTDAATIMTHAYQNERLGRQAIQNIGVVDTANTLPIITALKYVQQQQNQKYPIMGWRTDSAAAYGLSKRDASATKDATFRSSVFNIDKSFKVREIRIPLTGETASGLTATVKIWYDDASTSKTLTTINSTNYPSSRHIKYNHSEIEEAATAGYVGKSNFFLEVAFTGTSAIGAALPIEVTVETLDD